MSSSTIIPDSVLPVIQQALSDLDTAEKELELAKRAGLFSTPGGAQLADMAKKIADARTQFMNIKQVYFPGQ